MCKKKEENLLANANPFYLGGLLLMGAILGAAGVVAKESEKEEDNEDPDVDDDAPVDECAEAEGKDLNENINKEKEEDNEHLFCGDEDEDEDDEEYDKEEEDEGDPVDEDDEEFDERLSGLFVDTNDVHCGLIKELRKHTEDSDILFLLSDAINDAVEGDFNLGWEVDHENHKLALDFTKEFRKITDHEYIMASMFMEDYGTPATLETRPVEVKTKKTTKEENHVFLVLEY